MTYTTSSLANVLHDFFCFRMIQQRRLSPQTVASYRDTFRLFLTFAGNRLQKNVADLSLLELDTTLILAFLNYLESDRGNGIRTRNIRLAAIRSFLNYASCKEPTALPVIKQALAIPFKRFEKPVITVLSTGEVDAILQAPSADNWSGKRDRVMFATLYNSGARVSEIIGLKRTDSESQQNKHLLLHGKGRKDRIVPLLKNTTKLIRNWLSYIGPGPQTPLFPNRFGQTMSRSGVEKRLDQAVQIARLNCPTLEKKRITPHVFRHTIAVHLLQSGVDLSVIAILLGHESIVTTHHYLDADMEMKERALASVSDSSIQLTRYKPKKDIMAFLNSL